jgi:hypothetical protein
MPDKQFPFQDLEIWQRGAALSRPLFVLADWLDEQNRYRFAEQLRNTSNADFAAFLNFSRGSVFEVANIPLVLSPE